MPRKNIVVKETVPLSNRPNKLNRKSNALHDLEYKITLTKVRLRKFAYAQIKKKRNVPYI
jgi:hypothetical protein